jgi:NAD(P)-dependent dehydrogenase (short-subunit alcohol dehydrogenase family)
MAYYCLSLEKRTTHSRLFLGKRAGDGVKTTMAASLRILVTGAGRGIGRSISSELLSQGHRVALCARTSSDLESLVEEIPSEHLVIVADVLSPGAAELAVSKVVDAWGGLDVLILNAGDGVSAPIEKTTDEVWDRMLALNASAPFRFMRAAIPVMKSQKNGDNKNSNIIVIASKAGLIGEANVAAYTASKHAVVGLVRAAAVELAKYSITVNAICPDFVDTPMTQRSLEAAATRTGKSLEDVRSALESKLVGERFLTPEEVAHAAIAFIGSNETGSIQLIEGGD